MTAWWIKYNQSRRYHPDSSHHCIRSSIPLPALPSTPDTSFSWIRRDILKAINDIPPAEGTFSTHWNEEAEYLLAFGRQAGDRLAALSEAALDKVLCSVLALKTKLARRRAQRDKQQEEWK